MKNYCPKLSCSQMIRTLIICFTLLQAIGYAQKLTMSKDNFSTMHGQFSRTVKENFSSDSTQGEFYYGGSSNMYIEVHHPIHQIPAYRMDGNIRIKKSEADTWAKRFRVSGNNTYIDALVTDIMKDLKKNS